MNPNPVMRRNILRDNALARIWTVFWKELVDNLRDRRSISSSLLTPVFMPLFLIALIMVVGKSVMQETVETPLTLPVMGAEYAPNLIAFMKENNVTIIPAPADPSAAVRNGEVNLVLIIPQDYGKALSQGQPEKLELVLDSSRQSASPDIQRAWAVLNAYERTIMTMRLMARGVSPTILDVLAVKTSEQATPESQAVIFLNMMPFLLIMTIFMGGMNVIIDATAGERERGSLEPLLINPASRSEFVIGKLLAALPFALFSVALSLALFGLGFSYVPLEEYVGFKMSISTSTLLTIFALSVPMVVLASALQMVVASFTRSFKEAQTYLSLLPLVMGLPGAFLAFLPVKPTETNLLIPTFGQSILINQLMRGETVPEANLWLVSYATLAAALVLILLAIRLFQQERVLFSK